MSDEKILSDEFMYSIKTSLLSELDVGDFVFRNGEKGIIIEDGTTFLHKHKYKIVLWRPKHYFEYRTKYTHENDITVEYIKISERRKK